MRETSLYPTVKRFLETTGFDVKGDVNNRDLIAAADANLLNLTRAEMKLGLKLAASQLEISSVRGFLPVDPRAGKRRDPTFR